jgi:hypothetical protein
MGFPLFSLVLGSNEYKPISVLPLLDSTVLSDDYPFAKTEKYDSDDCLWQNSQINTLFSIYLFTLARSEKNNGVGLQILTSIELGVAVVPAGLSNDNNFSSFYSDSFLV